LKVLGLWHRLQFEKSSEPNARFPLWQPPQLCEPAGAKCIDASGAVTCLPRAEPARTVWQDVQLDVLPLECSA